jgi:hypothetical protein
MRKPTAWIAIALWIATAFAVAACTPGSQQQQEDVGEARSAVFANGGFETGATGQPPQGWVVTTNLNPNGVDGAVPETLAGLDLSGGGNALTTTIAAVNQPDPDLGAAASLRVCRYGAQCARVNFHSSSNFGNSKNVNTLSQSMIISGMDVDPSDGQIHVRFAIAPVLQNPAHPIDEQPYFFVQLTNLSQSNSILYRDFNLSAQPGVPWKTINGGTANEIDYVDWSLVDISPGGPALKMGDSVELQIIASGCSPGGHFGEIYVDGSTTGAVLPGLFVSGSGPAQANPGSDLTYTINYSNGSPAVACSLAAPCPGAEACVAGFCAETGVTISFTTPPGTTFQGITPPAGATCVTPAVGMAGTIICTFSGPVPAGASGGMMVTVNISSPGAACATTADCSTGAPICVGGALSCAGGVIACTTGTATCATGTPACSNGTPVCTLGETCDAGMCLYPQIVAGTYDIASTQETPLIGNKITTTDGCTVDSECPAGDWCDESADKCAPTLANSTPVPSDPGHSTGTPTCTTGAVSCMSGTAACAAGNATCTTGSPACFSGTPICVLVSLNGMCTTGAGALVCTSGVCDATNNECGYANGDGPCTAGNGDIVCQSDVCDTDNLCGYANGDGPCTVANGGVVCRSDQCSVTGTCVPLGGCNLDADCTGGKWCDETAHTCNAPLANGTQIPTDTPHMSPTLNGMCTAAAATLVCASGVCDATNNECGYANGDGPCTAANGGVVCQSGVCDANDDKCGYAVGDGPCTGPTGPVVCRSGACSANGTCEPPGGGCDVDADCAAGRWCDESTHTCTPTLANGTAVPNDPPHMSPTLNGMCTAAAGMLVCTSGVCDTKDNECGFATGDGPCTASNGDTVCRSGSCTTGGVCGCDVDADCSAGNWCDESTHTCTPTLPNGTAVPSDPSHMSPTLNGMCTAAAGMLVCTSGVCDTKDNECGFATGDGPCTPTNGGTVCRSGACAAGGVCGCDADKDCSTGHWCDESTHTCTPTLANGVPVPTDPPHMTPTLNGTCTMAAGALVCTSGVCDTNDNECGFANGDGPCSATTGATVCRSTICDPTSMVCVACVTSSQCPTTAPICDTTTNTCVQCESSSQCPSASPVCDGKSMSCVSCNGDNGSKATDPCPTTTAPFCFTMGSMAGTCGKCTASSQCENASDVCDSDTGVCGPPQGLTGITASGNGLICAAREPGRSSGDGAAGILGLMLAAAGLARRSRDRAKRG